MDKRPFCDDNSGILKSYLPQNAIASTEYRGWLSRNIRPVLALVVVTFSFAIFALVLLGDMSPKLQDNLAMMILGGLLTLVAQVVSYFFGSSRDAGGKRSFSFEKRNLHK